MNKLIQNASVNVVQFFSICEHFDFWQYLPRFRLSFFNSCLDYSAKTVVEQNEIVKSIILSDTLSTLTSIKNSYLSINK